MKNKLFSSTTISLLFFLTVFFIGCNEDKQMLNSIEGEWSINSVEFINEDSLVSNFGTMQFNKCKANHDCPGQLQSAFYDPVDFVYAVDAINEVIQLNTFDENYPIQFATDFDILNEEIDNKLRMKGSMQINGKSYQVIMNLNKQ